MNFKNLIVYLFGLLLFFEHSIGAETIEDTSTPESEQVTKELTSKDFRLASPIYVQINYSPMDLLIPSKKGFSLGTNTDLGNSWEIEYLNASLKAPLIEDLGEMSDTRISLIRRSFFNSNSFNFSWGLAYHSFKISLGSSILSRVTNGAIPSIDLIEASSWGPMIGIGNRWQWKNGIILSVDWISWSQPMVESTRKSAFLDYATDANDRKNVEDALKLIQYFPRFVFTKLGVGYSF